MKHYNIPIFINHTGCPHSCIFCSQNKINGQESDTKPEEVVEVIREYLKFLPKDANKEVAFFGGTFTGLSFVLQRKFLEMVKPFIESQDILGIRISTRPDYINEEILEQLKKYGVKTIELGVQSLNQEVLDVTERNYRVEIVKESVEKIKKFGFNLGIQIMLGLPGSNREKDLETARKVVELNPNEARIYPSLVLNGTKMEKMYQDKIYTPYTMDEAIDIGTDVYGILELQGIKVIRVGLQPSDDLRQDGVIVAGPFHPAFRELLEGEIFKRFIEKIQKKEEIKKNTENNVIEIKANEKNISKILGNKGINKKRYKELLKIKIDNTLRLDEFKFNFYKINRKTILRDVIKYS